MSISIDLQELTKLRQDIHQHPEVSHEEEQTARRVARFIKQYNPDEVITDIGGHGMVAIFDSKKDGPTVAIRSELDALPIQEKNNNLSYKSKYPQKGHKCGHDGHMTMVAGLAAQLYKEPPASGKVMLLFQPAEETGEGARQMLDDPKFLKLDIDYIFGLHNLPGFEKNTILLREGVFASASKGLIVRLSGKTSHAAEPEMGISPAQAVAEVIQKVKRLPDTLSTLEDFTLVTIIHAKLGERAFGTTPGDAVVMATLRAYRDEDLKILDDTARKVCKEIADAHSLSVDFEETEVFNSTINSEEGAKAINEAARKLSLSVKTIETPFRWSEDFGVFTQKFKGGFFGLGSGKETPALHNPDYDFPDDILASGINMFYTLIKKVTG